ncbi:hypothetical protein Rs2_09851 [Raphanus sativus]|nr:hypothetical protein Rs2_09851 [Raphanus sativus]
MNGQPHIYYSFFSETEPAIGDPDRKLNIKINRKNTNQTKIDFSIKFSTTATGHITYETVDLMEHMFSFHDIFFPVSEISLDIPVRGTHVRTVLSLQDFNPNATNRIDLEEALMDLGSSMKEPIPEDAGEVCSICHDSFSGTGVVNSLRCNHVYHHHCIVKWFHHNLTCPTCRDTDF